MSKQNTPKRLRHHFLAISLSLSAIGLSGCGQVFDVFNPTEKSEAQVTSQAQAKELKVVRNAIEASSPKTKSAASKAIATLPTIVVKQPTVPTISAVGYSSVASQPGKTLNQRRLMAIRAARMDAMRALTEQIHGLTVQGDTQLSENVIQSDTLRASVVGLVRGARTVKIEPKGSDTYAVMLEIDRATIVQLIKANRSW